MKAITLTLTVEELKMLTCLAADQLFRKEFIDPKMPGYTADMGQLNLAKALVARLRPMFDAGCAKRAQLPRINGATA